MITMLQIRIARMKRAIKNDFKTVFMVRSSAKGIMKAIQSSNRPLLEIIAPGPGFVKMKDTKCCKVFWIEILYIGVRMRKKQKKKK